MPVPAGPSSVISLDEVKLAVNEDTTDNDDELQRLIDAAEAEYAQYVGPLSGTATETLDGGASSLILGTPSVSAVTAAAYSDGTAIDVDDLDLDTRTGIVHWGYNTAGMFTFGRRNVTITYTIAALPAHHREAIIADVAGLFSATQRGGGSQRAGFPSEGYDVPNSINPIVLFPRIRALAAPAIA